QLRRRMNPAEVSAKLRRRIIQSELAPTPFFAGFAIQRNALVLFLSAVADRKSYISTPKLSTLNENYQCLCD
ncbi:MAG: hypothetical protein ORN53_01160, partial [Crocinitomicaceae bacterium]|nr:hypothetical protein [Crocinitomicaceae bacterium]